ncbi:MAG TPA: ATP-binding protein [Streptosporangiaceae bacterium]|nr:ATP-binding protein [Streptosporangiaceae bacterium]
MNQEMAGQGAAQLQVVASSAERKVTRVYPGTPEQVSRARAFIRGILPPGELASDIVLVTTEIITNAVRHSRSALPGGLFTVTLILRATEWIMVEVGDQGGPWTMHAHDIEHGRGLTIVAGLAGEDNWGVEGNQSGRTVWARFPWPTVTPAPAQPARQASNGHAPSQPPAITPDALHDREDSLARQS